ncbi:LuxR C-terminal-related transcriptional regulator [Azospirillum argentinense]
MQISANQQAGECHGMAPPVQSTESVTRLPEDVARVARLIACGHPDKEVAHRLGITEQAVRNAVRAAKRLLGVERRAQFAAVLPIRCGDAKVAVLSPQQESVMALVADGKRNKEIGRTLNIAAGTVHVHLTRIFQKLDVHNRVQAAIWWRSRATKTGAAPSQQMEA